jgi:hypothetical protein
MGRQQMFMELVPPSLQNYVYSAWRYRWLGQTVGHPSWWYQADRRRGLTGSYYPNYHHSSSSDDEA